MKNLLAAGRTVRAGFALLATPLLLSAQANTSPLGRTDFTAYYNQAPALPATTAEAATRAYGADLINPDYNTLDRFYQPFADKIQAAQAPYEQYYGERTNAYYRQQGQAGMYDRAVAQADKNPIIAGMGGTETVMTMTPEQAEKASRQAAAAYAADPFAASGVESAGMTALYQKVLNDPAYAARFQQMSEKEREAELRKYMANDKPQVKTPAQMAEENRRRAAQTQEADKVRAAMAFQRQIADLQMQISEAQTRYQNQRQALLNGAGNHAAIDADFQQKYKALPEVALGEYGHDKDPVQARKLRLEAAGRHREFAAGVLKQDRLLLAGLKSDYEKITTAYTDYMKAHRQEVNGNVADQMNGTETETMLAGFETGLLGLALDLANQSKACTQEAARWESNWQEINRN